MRDASAAILYAIEKEFIPIPEGDCLLIQGDFSAFSQVFPRATLWTPYAAEASLWQNAGHTVFSEDAKGSYSFIVLIAPKQKDELAFLIAKSLRILAPGGILVTAAENLAGGKILESLYKEFGLFPHSLSKHKSRVVWAVFAAPVESLVQQSLARGSFQQRKDGLWTCPGLFSWDRLDTGTEILLESLPEKLSGKGADLGAGIGEIGLRLLPSQAGIQKLICAEHDARAIFCARKNLAPYGERVDFLWADASGANLPIANLDFVVMNPPFHKGKDEDSSLGKAFVRQASRILKKGGRLILVANTHLPYERTLESEFSAISVLRQDRGFKVIEAIKA
jgi:16S rRNA (guanine1207-N2)-methyltransferase